MIETEKKKEFSVQREIIMTFWIPVKFKRCFEKIKHVSKTYSKFIVGNTGV